MANETRRNAAPAVALGTVLATTAMQSIGGEDQAWKTQEFVSRQKTTRVGGPPRGPPPTGGRPGGPPKGPPPRKSAPVGAPPKGGAKTAPGKGSGAPGGGSNSNAPKAPPISHFIAYIKGNYDPANPPTDGGEAAAPRQSEDIEFNPAEAKSSMETLVQADQDDMENMLNEMGGMPAVGRSSMSLGDDNPAAKPAGEMTLVE